MKNEKLPSLKKATKILCFDVESNGLHGEAFAIGAVVSDSSGQIYDEFSGRTEIVGDTDQWVEQNVLPVMESMQITHSSYKHLRDNFWGWFVKAQEQADYVLVMNGYPVEYRFLLQCQEDDMQSRYWEHPFPILDLTSMLLMVGYNQPAKNRLMQEVARSNNLSKHHPLHDAKITILAAFQALLP